MPIQNNASGKQVTASDIHDALDLAAQKSDPVKVSLSLAPEDDDGMPRLEGMLTIGKKSYSFSGDTEYGAMVS